MLTGKEMLSILKANKELVFGFYDKDNGFCLKVKPNVKLNKKKFKKKNKKKYKGMVNRRGSSNAAELMQFVTVDEKKSTFGNCPGFSFQCQSESTFFNPDPF